MYAASTNLVQGMLVWFFLLGKLNIEEESADFIFHLAFSFYMQIKNEVNTFK